MSRRVDAVYESGRLKLLDPVELDEGQRITIELVEPTHPALAALDALAESCRELTEEQWAVFDEATRRRPFFGEGSDR